MSDKDPSAPAPAEGRGLSPWMLDEFKSPHGLLHPVLEAVREDPRQRLEFAIRDHYVNIYFMGTNLMEIRETGDSARKVATFWDPRYLPHHAEKSWAHKATQAELAVETWLEQREVLGRQTLASEEDVARHVASIPYRMNAMVACKKHHPKRERQVQQEVARLCNDSAGGQYLICDTEYAFEHDRHDDQGSYVRSRKVSSVDLVAARRPPADSADAPARLVLIELKYREGQLDGPSGIRSHVRDIGRYLEENGTHSRIADDMIRVAEQRYDLGVAPAAIPKFDVEPPVDYLIAVADHNAKSQKLRDALLGRHGLDEGPFLTPWGMSISVVTLDGSYPQLNACRPVPLETIIRNPTPAWLFCGRLVRRRLRKDELGSRQA